MNTDLKNNIEYILNFFSDSKEGLLILDNEKNISYMNYSAKLILENLCNLTAIGQRFNFDVCVLNEDDILKYSPVYAAIESKELFKAEALYQIGENSYKRVLIRSFNSKTSKVVLLYDYTSDIENTDLRKQILASTDKVNQLLKDNKDYANLKERAESQAIRTGLIHRISTSIRDTLDIEEIIKTALSEISASLGIYRGYYADFADEKLVIKYDWREGEFSSLNNAEINVDQDYSVKEVLTSSTSQLSSSYDEKTNENKPRLITPVSYRGNILGIIVFYHRNQNRTWHTEEVSLIEAVAAQLAAAIKQASLFEQLDNQNTKLETALTKLKVAQSQLIQSEKMASLGKLVAGVAHEINTPIGAINSNNDVVSKCTEKYKDIAGNIPEISKFFDILSDINAVNAEAINRINSIVKSLKNFARLDEAELKEVDIHDGLRSTIKLLNHETKNRIIIEENYGNLPPVQCYPNLLNQVFMNILMNAIQSIEGKGIIKIQTRYFPENVEIIISDTGIGISKDNIDKIFDPGFTTKGVGVGTGLGLSICYQIIEKHKGSILVESELEVGTTFTIKIPLKIELN